MLQKWRTLGSRPVWRFGEAYSLLGVMFSRNWAAAAFAPAETTGILPSLSTVARAELSDSHQNAVSRPKYSLHDVPAGVWTLGVVSMLMDMSSEMIHALLPVYLVTVLRVSMLTVGVIEGVAEATASVTKVFSGALSDWLGKRKFLTALGYGLAALTKPVFPLATSVGWIMAARFVDRIGKGIRGAPRDALLADIAPARLRGASFGLRQSLDTVGAVIGPLAAIGLMWLTANHFNIVFWVAIVPAFLAWGLIVVA